MPWEVPSKGRPGHPLRELSERVRRVLLRVGRDPGRIRSRPLVVPLMVRHTARCQEMVQQLYERGILVVGLAFPVVPQGDDTIRFQINAAHTESDIDEVLAALADITG